MTFSELKSGDLIYYVDTDKLTVRTRKVKAVGKTDSHIELYLYDARVWVYMRDSVKRKCETLGGTHYYTDEALAKSDLAEFAHSNAAMLKQQIKLLQKELKRYEAVYK